MGARYMNVTCRGHVSRTGVQLPCLTRRDERQPAARQMIDACGPRSHPAGRSRQPGVSCERVSGWQSLGSSRRSCADSAGLETANEAVRGEGCQAGGSEGGGVDRNRLGGGNSGYSAKQRDKTTRIHGEQSDHLRATTRCSGRVSEARRVRHLEACGMAGWSSVEFQSSSTPEAA